MPPVNVNMLAEKTAPHFPPKPVERKVISLSKNVARPIVVYHVAGMGDWKEVVDEQLQLLQSVGLTTDIRITYLGKEYDWLESRLKFFEIEAEIVANDPNLNHCETLAMMEVDRIAKEENSDRPILYMHTKGVSNPGNVSKRAWRHLMEAWVIRRWRVNVTHLKQYDAIGVNWIQGGPQHFSGTFWIATSDWIRRLPIFKDYHIASGLHRYTCELWIGAAQWCKALSLGCKDEPFWNFGYDYGRWMPKTPMLPNRDMKAVDDKSTFGDIFTYYNTDKDTDHSYGKVYQALFPPESRGDVTTVLELGVQHGRSLHAWETAFPNATIYGMDITDSVESIGMRTIVGLCNATDPKEVARMMEQWGIEKGTFDLIVDDASHKFQDQLASAAIFKPYLSPSGVYVIEDIYPSTGAGILSNTFGGVILDRRGVRNRFDDLLVIVGKDKDVIADLENIPETDLKSIFE